MARVRHPVTVRGQSGRQDNGLYTVSVNVSDVPEHMVKRVSNWLHSIMMENLNKLGAYKATDMPEQKPDDTTILSGG